MFSIRRRILPAIMAGGIILSMVGCGLLPEEEEAVAPPLVEPEKIEYKTLTAKRKDLEDTLVVGASVVSAQSEYLAFMGSGGYIAEIYVSHGDEVKAGDILIELEGKDVKTQIEQQRIALRQAELSYENVKTGRITQQQKDAAHKAWKDKEGQLEGLKTQLNALKNDASYAGEAELVVREAEAKLLAAQEARAALDNPGPEDTVQPSDISQAEVNISKAENALADARGELEARRGGKGTPVAELEAAIQAAAAEMQNLKQAYEALVNYSASASDLESASLHVKSAKLTLKQLEERLESLRLIASVDGVVTYISSDIRVSSAAPTYVPLVRISNPDQVALEYSGNDALEFVVGAEVSVVVGDETYMGEVIQTPREAPRDSDGEVAPYVQFRLRDYEGSLPLGTLTRVTLVRDRREDALVLPTDVIYSYMGRNYVLLLVDGQRTERDIEVGLKTATEVEVKNGLEEDELVIYQ